MSSEWADPPEHLVTACQGLLACYVGEKRDWRTEMALIADMEMCACDTDEEWGSWWKCRVAPQRKKHPRRLDVEMRLRGLKCRTGPDRLKSRFFLRVDCDG